MARPWTIDLDLDLDLDGHPSPRTRHRAFPKWNDDERGRNTL